LGAFIFVSKSKTQKAGGGYWETVMRMQIVASGKMLRCTNRAALSFRRMSR
jgi:hypothetical protein